MSSNSDYDRLAARLRGTASPEELAALGHDLATDPARARRAEELESVWQLTGSLVDAPSSRTTFENVLSRERGERRMHIVRRAAAAILVLAPIAWAVYLLSNPEGKTKAPAPIATQNDRVELEHVPIEESSTTAEAELDDRELALLADYTPTSGETVQFLTSLEDARLVAAATDRQVFVFGYVPGCPWCVELRGTTFAEPKMRELVTRAVPVAIDLLAAETLVSAPLFERGYPAIELQDQNGAVLELLSGPPGTVDLVAGLERALGAEAQETPALAWATMNDLARKLVKSSSDERQGRFSSAWSGFTKVVELGSQSVLGRDGALGRDRIAKRARASLVEARTLFGLDPAASVRMLEESTRAFEGTPFDRDLDLVLDRVRSLGRFPVLVARGS